MKRVYVIVASLVFLAGVLGFMLLRGTKTKNAQRGGRSSGGTADGRPIKDADGRRGKALLGTLNAAGTAVPGSKEATRPAILPGKPYVGHLAALVGPHAAPRTPPIEDGKVLKVWNMPIAGLGVVTLSEPKDTPNAWSFSIQQAVAPEDLAPGGGVTRLCQHDGITVYEIDQGPLAGAFLEQRNPNWTVLANQEFITSQNVSTVSCLKETGRL